MTLDSSRTIHASLGGSGHRGRRHYAAACPSLWRSMLTQQFMIRGAAASLLALSLWLLVAPALPSTQQYTVNLDLSGSWKWQTEEGRKRGDKGDIRSGWHRPDFDDSSWATIEIGRDWESQAGNFNGVAWYRRTFSLDGPATNLPLMLRLGTPDDGAEVYLNGESIGIWTSRERIATILPAGLLRWGEPNTLAVRVWDWYKKGGLKGSNFAIGSFEPFQAPIGALPQTPSALRLKLADSMPDYTLSSPRWQFGWRDEGTSDTRPKLRTVRSAFNGQDAIEVDVWFPNSTEFLDYQLGKGEDGVAWAKHQGEALTFWYRTSSLHGDISIRLADGQNRWKRSTPVWQAMLRVKPGSWTRAVIPFDDFVAPNPQTRLDPAKRLADLGLISHLSIGYGNHHLDGPGKIQLSGFQIERTTESAALASPIKIQAPWLHWLEELPAALPATASQTAITAATPTPAVFSVADLGNSLPKHPGKSSARWFRQKVRVPHSWQDRNLRLRLGTPSSESIVRWNNKILGIFAADSPVSVEIPKAWVDLRGDNEITISQAPSNKKASFATGTFDLSATDTVQILITDTRRHDDAKPPSDFEMGATPRSSLHVLFRYALPPADDAQSFTLRYEIYDCFDRTVADGTAKLDRQAFGSQARIALTTEQTRILYYGEWFRARMSITDETGNYVGAYALPNGPQRHYKLRYEDRDDLVLPALEPTFEHTPHGHLKLIDVVKTTTPPDKDPHPYKEGGIRNSWVGRRANSPWLDGISIERLGTRPFREARNNQFFAYRIGRGRLSRGKAYLLRVLVPDDKARYVAMDIKAGRNYQGTGYKTQSAFDQDADVPGFSQSFHWFDHIVINGDTTYGYKGPRSTSSENGFWVVFHDIGRVYAAAYDGGPAVAEMRLYEIPDDYSTAPTIPRDSKRILMMDWERQPESRPEDVVRYARLVGMNALAPTIQKWAFHGFWPSKLGFAPPTWYKTAPPGQADDEIYREWLNATRDSGVKLIPRIEYGGSRSLPRAARVIGPNGKIDPAGRYVSWGANLLHPATLSEFKQLIDELIGRHIEDNPQLAGLLWRQRQHRLKCSYGPQDIALFAKETGTDIPPGDAKTIAQWASKNPDYGAWWQGKRAEFIRAIRDHLRSYRSDLVLYYYNWDEDGFRPPIPGGRSKQEWTAHYDVDQARKFAGEQAEKRAALSPSYYVAYVTRQSMPHRNLVPGQFSQDDGISLIAPVSQRYLSGNKDFLDLFRTKNGFAIGNVLSYEEKGRWNMQWDDHETSEMTFGPGEFSLINEHKAQALVNPNLITTTSYTFGRGWVTEFRRFAESYFSTTN